MMVRSPDAVMGVAFMVVFPLTFLSSAFVPIESLPNVLQWIASLNPGERDGRGDAQLFGNPLAPVTKHVWPIDHPVPAACIYCLVVLAIAVPGALRRYRARTSD